MKHLPKLGLFAALAAMSVASWGQVTKTGDKYLLRVKYTQGATLAFNTTSTTSAVASPITMKMVMKVKKVTTQKTTIEFSFASKSMTVDVNSRNQPVGGGEPAVGTSLPEKPVKVGETWTGTSPISSPTGASGNVTTKYTFKGLATEDGKKVARIEVSMTGVISSKGTMSILVSDGTLYSNTTNLTMTSPKMTVKSVWKRI